MAEDNGNYGACHYFQVQIKNLTVCQKRHSAWAEACSLANRRGQSDGLDWLAVPLALAEEESKLDARRGQKSNKQRYLPVLFRQNAVLVQDRAEIRSHWGARVIPSVSAWCQLHPRNDLPCHRADHHRWKSKGLQYLFQYGVSKPLLQEVVHVWG